jgi:hypothetical protein
MRRMSDRERKVIPAFRTAKRRRRRSVPGPGT